VKFGATYLDSFLGDQVGERVTGRAWTVVMNLMMAVVLMFVLFFPWFFLGLKKIREKLRLMSTQHAAFLGWVLIWVLGIILMSGLVIKFYERYLLPVTPVAAVALAWLLIQSSSKGKGKAIKLFIYFLLGLNIILLAGGVYLNIGLGASGWIYAGMVLSLIILVSMVSSVRKGRQLYLWLSVAMMLIFFNLSFITYQLSLPHQGTQVKQFVTEHQIPKGSQIAFIGHLHTGSKIRIGLGKDYYMTDLPRDDFQSYLDQYPYIICEEAVKKELEGKGYQVWTASLMWDLKLIPEMPLHIWSGHREELLEATGSKIRIGLGKDDYMTDLPRDDFQSYLDQYPYIICEEAVKKELDGKGYQVWTASLMWDLKLIPEMLLHIWSGNSAELLEATGK